MDKEEAKSISNKLLFFAGFIAGIVIIKDFMLGISVLLAIILAYLVIKFSD